MPKAGAIFIGSSTPARFDLVGASSVGGVSSLPATNPLLHLYSNFRSSIRPITANFSIHVDRILASPSPQRVTSVNFCVGDASRSAFLIQYDRDHELSRLKPVPS
jgi:hypothetical protein